MSKHGYMSKKPSCLIMAVILCMSFSGSGAQTDSNTPAGPKQDNASGPLDPNAGPGIPAPIQGPNPVEKVLAPALSGPESMRDTGSLKLGLESEQDRDRDRSTLQLFFRSMGALLIVLALMIAALSLSKRVLPKLGKHAGKEIEIIETTLLGPRKYLHVVKVANQRLLLGSTNDRINMLAHLVDDLAALDIEQASEREEI